jgi:integrase
MNKLSDAKLRTLTAPGKHFDGGGLYLEVTPAGGRYWRLKYRHGGKERRLAFGVYPEVSLKTARERRAEARAVLDRGEDPATVKREAQARAVREAAATFESVARDWLAHQSAGWTPGTLDAIRKSLEAAVFPTIGARAMAQLRPRDVMPLIKRIDARGAGETAGRVLQRVKAVFRFAVVHDRIESNPMLDLKPSELLKPRQVKHRAAMADKDLPGFLAALDAYEGEPSTLAALRLLMLTAVRPGELRGALWAEIDTEAAVWRIPGERMKMKAPHVVPLSAQALALLEAQHKLTGTRALVFPSPYYPDKPLSENTLNSALARMGYKGEHSAHGFRALFSTVANECGHDPDVIERQLAHVEKNEVRAAYHRSTYLEARAALMSWWADYLDGRKGGKVIGMGRKAAA